MPRPRGSGKGETARINIRLDPETEAFYKRKANESGVSLSQFLRDTLVQGIVCESVAEIDARLQQRIDAAVAAADKIIQQRSLHVMLERALLESHAMLVKIVEAQDVQVVYRAQEIARDRLQKMRAGSAKTG